MSRWITFKEIDNAKGKTKVWRVASKESDAFLGTVKWHGPWRKYCFFPNEDTLFEEDCLEDIAKFLQGLKAERKKTKVDEMKNLKTFDGFLNENEMDKLDKRIMDLEDRGYVHTRTGLKNDNIPGALLYHQIEEPTDEEWEKFLGDLDAKRGVNERIEKVDGDYVVYPKKGGKRLGTHKTKKGALKQLAAIEISKAKR